MIVFLMHTKSGLRVVLSVICRLLLFQILKFMHAQSTYFHQGYDLMNDLDQYMKNVSSQVRNTFVISQTNYESQKHG